jgi:hypothetical protein
LRANFVTQLQCLAQQEAPVAEPPHSGIRDFDSVEPLRPSKDGNSSSASSSGSGRLSPLPADFDMKQNSAGVEQMIMASSKSSRLAMDNLRHGAQPFARLQENVKENVKKASAAVAPAVAAPAAAAPLQIPKSRSLCVLTDAKNLSLILARADSPSTTAAAATMMCLCRRRCVALAAQQYRTNPPAPAA